MKKLRHFARERASSVAVEYALLAVFLALPVIAWMQAIRVAIVWIYGDFEASINAGGPSVDGL
ncbi:MAG: hypothetical protein M3Z96_09055 [Pseudomonadota bacterium]|nr:hypothetical protein [Pseudomonadota bacterium]